MVVIVVLAVSMIDSETRFHQENALARQGAKMMANGAIDMGAWWAERIHDKLPLVLKVLKKMDPAQSLNRIPGVISPMTQTQGNNLLSQSSGMNEVTG
jgi:hypothetical protein